MSDCDLEATRVKVNEVLQDTTTLDQMRKMMIAMTIYSEVIFQDFEIPKEVAAYAQDKFVAVRKSEFEVEGKVKTDDAKFHRLLTFARYLSVANGEISLTKAIYDQTLEIENGREKRIEQRAAELTPKTKLQPPKVMLESTSDKL